MPNNFAHRAWHKVHYYWKSLSFLQLLVRIVIDGCAKLGLRIEPYYLMAEGLSLGTCTWDTQDFADYEFRFLTEREMPALTALPGRTLSEPELVQRLRDGGKCFAALSHGEIIAFTWWSLSECRFELHPLFVLQPNEAYLFDAYTLEACRGNGLAPYLRYRCYQELARLGREHCYSITVMLNQPALHFKQKLGARIVHLGLFIEVLRYWRGNFTLKPYVFYWPDMMPAPTCIAERE
jgi:GNAT superfamily N-acetyltransferase